MDRHIAVSALLVVSTMVTGQQARVPQVTLGQPKAIAIDVKSILWEDTGRALSYEVADVDGKGQGLYNLESGKGKVVFRPGNKNLTNQVWLKGRPVLIQVYVENVEGRDAERTSIWALDSVNLTAKQLWSIEHLPKERPEIGFEVSPSRPHAIVNVSSGQKQKYYVITEGANGMVFSQDVTNASLNDTHFNNWSIDGTAYFTHGAQSGTIDLSNAVVAGGDDNSSKGERIRTFEVKLRFTAVLGELVGDGRKLFVVSNPPVQPGADVLELMPNNGSLRPVKARGPYVGTNSVLAPVGVETTRATLKHGPSQGNSSPLWLVTGPQPVAEERPVEGAPTSIPANTVQTGTDSNPAFLVSGDATMGWLSPVQNAIAFTKDGALFIRTVSTKSN